MTFYYFFTFSNNLNILHYSIKKFVILYITQISLSLQSKAAHTPTPFIIRAHAFLFKQTKTKEFIIYRFRNIYTFPVYRRQAHTHTYTCAHTCCPLMILNFPIKTKCSSRLMCAFRGKERKRK